MMTIEADYDMLLSVTLSKAIMPFQRQIADLAVDAVHAEIDEQNLIEYGAFRKSITSLYDQSNFDEIIAGAVCKSDELERLWRIMNPKSEGRDFFFYALALEYGTTKMLARAPFRKSISRVQSVLSGGSL